MAEDGLSDGDARALAGWVLAARDWAEATQEVVGTATVLATVSREVSDRLDGRRISPGGLGSAEDGEALAEGLRLLADAVENEAADLRDRYLATAASLEQYRDVLS